MSRRFVVLMLAAGVAAYFAGVFWTRWLLGNTP